MPPADHPATHRIRLRGPWEFEWLKAPAGLAADRRTGGLKLPMTWQEAFGSLAGTVRLSRRFGSPEDPDLTDRIWLEIAIPHAEAAALLNGEWLGTLAPGTARFDVSGRLADRNRLDLDLRIDDAAPPNAPLPEVALLFEGRA